MASLIPEADKSIIQGAFDSIHDTFSRTIQIYVDGESALIDTDGSHNPLYGDGGGEKIGGKPNLVSYTKRARIKYMGLQDRQTLAGGSNVNYPRGTIRMKVDSDTYSIIRKAKKIKIDDRLCELIGAPARPGPFFPNYWTIELRQID